MPELSAFPLFQPADSPTYDNGAYPLAYDFKVLTSAGGGEVVADSGWLYDPQNVSNIDTWSVPVGALRDGETYWVAVYTDDSELTLQPLTPTTITTFTVKLRQGAGGPSPTDTVGSTPSGTSTPAQGAPSPGLSPASVTVNLVTGDLALTAGTHGLQTVSGPVAVSLDYNSLDANLYGLAGQYFADSGDHAFSAQDPLIGQRTDPDIDFNWGITPIGATPLSDNAFLTRWTGTIYVPPGSGTLAGDWEFGVQAGGGMRVCIDQAGSCTDTNAAAAAWSAGSSKSAPSFGAQINDLAVGPHAITVEAWTPDGLPVPTILWAQNMTPSAPNPSPFIVPSSWLSSTPASLSAGWSLSADSFNAAWQGLVDEGSQVVLLGSGGNTADFLGAGTGQAETFQPPAGDTDLLSRNADGTLKLTAADGDVYVFNTNGSVASITTAQNATATPGTNPAALQYTYSGNPLELTAITDPVSGRQVTLVYNGNGTCPATSSTGVALDAPVDMLCAINYWDGTQTTFAYNSEQELAQVDNPGSVSQFAYDAAGRLTEIEDPLAYAAVAANVRTDCPPGSEDNPTCETVIGYMTAASTCSATFTPDCAQVASVTQPAPTAGAVRPQRDYCYADSPSSSSCTPTASTTTVTIAGFTPPTGWASKVTYDSAGKIVSRQSSTGATATSIWDGAERPIVAVDPTGEQTTTVYDDNSNVTDTYGPAPTACFSTSAPYLPLADLGGCGVGVVPHVHHGYDEGIAGPKTSFWSNTTLSGPPCTLSTGLAGDSTLAHTWGDSTPACVSSSGQWSMQMTGLIDFPTAGAWTFQLASQSSLAVSINGGPLGTATGTGSWGTPTTVTLDVAAAGWEQLQVDYVPVVNPSPSQSNGFSVSYQPPGGTMTAIPYAAVDPDYGLGTSTVDPDGKVTATRYSDPTGGIDPVDGLVTQTISDPSAATIAADGLPASLGDPTGLSLTTTDSYEPPGPGAYFRKTSSTLPAGNATTYSYYTGTDGPLDAVCGVSASTPQGGLLEQQTDPPADGVSRVQQFVYDAAGRQVGVRVGSTTTIDSAGWRCTTYDTGGRMTGQTWPAANGAPARTVTDSYSVGGNPLVSAVTDTAGTTVTSTVDLLGRVASYTDANGKTTTTSYDQAGRVTTTTGPQGTTTLGYDPASGQPVTTTVNGTTLATASYNTAGQMTSVAYENGTTAAIGYDAYGRQDAITDTNTSSGALVDGDQYTYSPGGRVTTELEDTGGTSLGNPNPAGGSDYTYDGAGRLVSAYAPGHAFSYGYAPTGGCGSLPTAGDNTDRTSVTDNGATTNYCYNGADQLTQGQNPELYVGFGRVDNVAAAGTTSGYTYNLTPTNGNLYLYNPAISAPTAPTATQSPAGTSLTLGDLINAAPGAPANPSSSISAVSGAAGATGTGIATLGVSPVNVGDALVLSVKVSSTSVSVASVTGGGATWTKLTAATDSGQGVDTELWLGTVTAAGSSTITVNYTGDVSSVGTELVAQEYTNGTGASTTWSADAVGHSDNTTSSTTVAFPSLTPTGSSGELYVGYARVDYLAGSGTTSGYSYDVTPNGNLFMYDPDVTATTAPTGSESPAGRSLAVGALLQAAGTPAAPTRAIASVGTLASASGTGLGVLNVSPASVGDALVLSVKINSASLSVSSVTGGGATWTKLNAASDPTQSRDMELWLGTIAAAGASTITVTYSGDASSVATELSAQEFSDDTGAGTVWATDTGGSLDNTNPSTTVAFPSLTPYASSGGSDPARYAYNADGDQTIDGGTTLTWDSADRLASTTNTSGVTTTYTYDPLDRVTQQQDGPTITRYAYGGHSDNPVAVVDTNGGLLDALVDLPGGVIVTIPASGLADSTWSYTNIQGDTTRTTDNVGVPTGAPTAYDPWGVTLDAMPVNTPKGGPVLGAYGEQGKLTDPDSDLIAMGARPFDPAEARFDKVDPMNGGCANPYTYAYGDPMGHSDLSGMEACPTPTAKVEVSGDSVDLTLSVEDLPGIALVMAWDISSNVNGVMANHKDSTVGNGLPSIDKDIELYKSSDGYGPILVGNAEQGGTNGGEAGSSKLAAVGSWNGTVSYTYLTAIDESITCTFVGQGEFGGGGITID